MSHYFNNGTRTPALDAAYLNPPGAGKPQMTKAKRAPVGAPTPSEGIFGPEWYKWRGATLAVELNGEAPFVARLDAVSSPNPSARLRATLTLLDAQGRPQEVREVPWPLAGRVRVVRAP